MFLYISMSISMVLLIGVVVFGYTNGFDIKNILSGQGMVEDRLVYDHNKKDAAKEAQATEKNNNTAIVTIDTQQAKIAFAQENSVDVASLQPIEGTNSYRVPIPTENIKLPPAYSADYKISKNITYRALATPNDPLFSQQWHLTKVSSPAAWDISTGLPSAKVAVIDTGFALNHQDLSAKLDIANAYDFANNDASPMAGTNNPNGDYISHGTLTAGLAGAATNNGLGVASLGWNISVLPVQALDDDGFGDTASIISAINWSVSKGAKVISLSLGSPDQDGLLAQAIQSAVDSGVVVVAASGNDGCDCVIYPANYASVIAVGSSNSNDSRSSFSSYGDNLDVLAPGEGTIRTTYMTASNMTSLYTTSASGTSISTPIVSALAGLIKSIKSDTTTAEVQSLIRLGADKVSGMGGQDFTKQYGYGRVNAQKTLSLVKDYRWEYAGQSGPSNFVSGQKGTWTVSAKNIGTTTWYNSGNNPVLLGTSNPRDRASAFCSTIWGSCNRSALLNEPSVAPGATGTFTFEVQAPTVAGVYQEYFNLVAEGMAWMNDPGLYFQSNVSSGSFSMNKVSDNFPASIDPGATANVSVVVQNTGSASWYKDGKFPINLGTYSPTDRNSLFADITWAAPNRPVNMLEATVAPGQNGTFNFTIKAPVNPGTYTESFSLVAEGYTWFNQPLNFTTVVNGEPAPVDGYTEVMNSGQSLSIDQALASSDGRYNLIMQSDGNLVLYSPNRALWSTATWGRPATNLVVQSDGNLVIYDNQGRYYWASGTFGRGGDKLVMQNDGNLVLYTAQGIPLWYTNTQGQL
ncbi:MAG: Peptidase protein [Patescibacteria group bacterium]|nr:Peptidase protein [Patescibacteria group bacterium]